MSKARRAVLRLSSMALAVLALTALPSAASATADPQVLRQTVNGAVPCPGLTAMNACKFHLDGEMATYWHIFGMESVEAECHLELEGRINEDGLAIVDVITMTNGGHGDLNCSTVWPRCPDSFPWTFYFEEVSGGVLGGTFGLCAAPAELGGGECHGEFPFELQETGSGATESQRVRATDQRIETAFCEIDLTLDTEHTAHDRLHVHHL
jgi:hypothetical protein